MTEMNKKQTASGLPPLSWLDKLRLMKAEAETIVANRKGVPDFICDGIKDEVEVMAAIDYVLVEKGASAIVETGKGKVRITSI